MAEKKHQGRQIRAQIRTGATPEQVWEAWTVEGRLQAALTRLAGVLGNGGGE